MRVCGYHGDPFPAESDMRQSCLLAHLFFNLAPRMGDSSGTAREGGVQIDRLRVSKLVYGFTVEHIGHFEETFGEFVGTARKIGLRVTKIRLSSCIFREVWSNRRGKKPLLVLTLRMLIISYT